MFLAADSKSIPLSLYVVADLDSQGGLALIKEALHSIVWFSHLGYCYAILTAHEQDTDSLIRICFIHNPTHTTNDGATQRAPISWSISHLLSTNTLSKASPSHLLRALGLESPVAPNDSPQVPMSQEETLSELTGGVAVSDFEPESYAKYVKTSRLVTRELQLTPGQQALVVNGRVGVISCY